MITVPFLICCRRRWPSISGAASRCLCGCLLVAVLTVPYSNSPVSMFCCCRSCFGCCCIAVVIVIRVYLWFCCRTRPRLGLVDTSSGMPARELVIVRLCLLLAALLLTAWSPLSRIGASPVPQVVVDLLRNGASPDLSREDGWAPLHAAARFGHAATAGALLAEGRADFEAITADHGSTALHVAAISGFDEVCVCCRCARAKRHLRCGRRLW